MTPPPALLLHPPRQMRLLSRQQRLQRMLCFPPTSQHQRRWSPGLAFAPRVQTAAKSAPPRLREWSYCWAGPRRPAYHPAALLGGEQTCVPGGRPRHYGAVGGKIANYPAPPQPRQGKALPWPRPTAMLRQPRFLPRRRSTLARTGCHGVWTRYRRRRWPSRPKGQTSWRGPNRHRRRCPACGLGSSPAATRQPGCRCGWGAAVLQWR